VSIDTDFDGEKCFPRIEAARRTVSGQEAPTAEQVERAFLSQSTWTTIGYAVNLEDFQYLIAKLFAAPIPATEMSDDQIRRIWLIETGTTEQDSPLAILDFARAILAAKEPK
jgi:hypothetical protein